MRWVFFPLVLYIVYETASTEKRKFCFKTRSHGIIHTFKNYFVTLFLAISFQFSAINNIQTKTITMSSLEKVFSVLLTAALAVLHSSLDVASLFVNEKAKAEANALLIWKASLQNET